MTDSDWLGCRSRWGAQPASNQVILNVKPKNSSFDCYRKTGRVKSPKTHMETGTSNGGTRLIMASFRNNLSYPLSSARTDDPSTHPFPVPSMRQNRGRREQPRVRLHSQLYEQLRQHVLRRDGWECPVCRIPSNLEVRNFWRKKKSEADTASLSKVIRLGWTRPGFTTATSESEPHAPLNLPRSADCIYSRAIAHAEASVVVRWGCAIQRTRTTGE